MKTQTINYFIFHESRGCRSLRCVERGLQSDVARLKDVKIWYERIPHNVRQY